MPRIPDAVSFFLCYHGYYATSYYFEFSYIYYYSEERNKAYALNLIFNTYYYYPKWLDGVYELEKVMSSKRMFKIKSTKNFLNNHLDHIHYTINKLNEQISGLYETIYNQLDQNDNEMLQEEVTQLEITKHKLMHTSITLCGWDWLKLLGYDAENEYYYVSIPSGNMYWVFPFRQSSINPNLKYRLGFWVNGELTLFPVYKQKVSMSSPQTKQRKRLSREEKRDKGH